MSVVGTRIKVDCPLKLGGLLAEFDDRFAEFVVRRAEFVLRLDLVALAAQSCAQTVVGGHRAMITANGLLECFNCLVCIVIMKLNDDTLPQFKIGRHLGRGDEGKSQSNRCHHTKRQQMATAGGSRRLFRDDAPDS